MTQNLTYTSALRPRFRPPWSTQPVSSGGPTATRNTRTARPMVKAHNKSRAIMHRTKGKHIVGQAGTYKGDMHKPASNERGRAASAKTHSQPRPSELFDWDDAIARFKKMMKELED